MTQTQRAKGETFRALHQRSGAFVIPNPWDVGKARMLAGLGFEALATTSAGLAVTLGRRDGGGLVPREAALAHARALVAAGDLPVSADLETGSGDALETVAETVRLAAAAGLVGCSIEDATGDRARPLYDESHAVERVIAAVEAARSLSIPFMLTARAENFLRGRPDLADTIGRLQAFESAGADVLFAPCVPDIASIRTICAALARPFNVMIGGKGQCFPVAELAAAGVRRVSLGRTLFRAAMTAFLRGASEIKQQGTFSFAEGIVSFGELYTVTTGKDA